MVPPHALVAQLDRASDFDSEGREFESLRARHFSVSEDLADTTEGSVYLPWIFSPLGPTLICTPSGCFFAW